MFESSTIEHGSKTNLEVLDLANLGQVQSFMSKIFPGRDEQDEWGRPAGQPEIDAQPAIDLDEIELLVVKASKAIEVLATRCQIVEHELAEAVERAAEHEQTANRWKKLTLELRAQVTAEQGPMRALKARAESAEARVAALEASADDARERVVVATARSARLHNQVMAAFGRKSPVHSVLQAVTVQEAAE